MTAQRSLFPAPPDTGTHRANDPATSIEDALSVDVPARQFEVLYALEKLGGQGTVSEVCALLASEGRWRETAPTSRRITDLCDGGLVVKTGQVRPGRSGRPQTVWERIR